MTNSTQTSSLFRSITEVAKVEKIVDYSFERNDKSNVLAIHPTRPLIAYLINIQRAQKISKGWSASNDSAQSPSTSSLNGSISQSTDRNKTVSIRIIDYVTRQRCLAKGIYYARPTSCVFSINSIQCSQNEVTKLVVVDRLANVYLYDLSYFLNELTATRIVVIRSLHDASPYEHISVVWCPFVPCEDFDDGDGGLRLAVATNSKIEIFAVDRLSGKTGELQRSDLKGAYKCIQDEQMTDIVSLSISPDCSTISASDVDNRVTFFSCDIDDSAQRRLHNWKATMTDSKISTLIFLDDYPKLLEDSTMQFWGAAFVGTKAGQMLLIDLRNWSVYQKMHLNPEDSGPKNFEYRIDSTSRNIVAINGNQCFIVQVEHDYPQLPKISKTTRLSLHTTIYSFVIKSSESLELFTISAYSLERNVINLNALEAIPIPTKQAPESNGTIAVEVSQMDKMVEVLFNRLNMSFSLGLDEFLNEVRCEVNDLKSKLNQLSRDVSKLQQQLQDGRQR